MPQTLLHQRQPDITHTLPSAAAALLLHFRCCHGCLVLAACNRRCALSGIGCTNGKCELRASCVGRLFARSLPAAGVEIRCHTACGTQCTIKGLAASVRKSSLPTWPTCWFHWQLVHARSPVLHDNSTATQAQLHALTPALCRRCRCKLVSQTGPPHLSPRPRPTLLQHCQGTA